MNARGSGVVSRERRDFTKCVEGFPKPGEGKSKSLGRKFKARGSEIQASVFRESGLFKGLRANPNCEIASRSSLRLGPRPVPARVNCEDAPPQRLATRIEPRLLRKSRPAIHARLASGRARGLFGNQEQL